MFLVRFDLAKPFFASQTKSMTNQNFPNGAVTKIKITTENNNNTQMHTHKLNFSCHPKCGGGECSYY